MRVLISGGGTGGHIFPALSIADEVKRRHPDAEVLFVGAQGRMEMTRVPAAGYKIVGLPVTGFDRKRPWRNVKVLYMLWRSMRMARKVLRDFHPDVAVGVGGYASGPMLKESQRRDIPTLLQEQNSYAGVTNKLLAKKAKAICVAYESMNRFFPDESIVLTGNPVRAALMQCSLTQAEAKKQLGFDAGRPLVLVVGGSLGARTINEAVASALPTLAEQKVQVLWQTGKIYIDKCAPEAKAFAPGVQATAFVDDMAMAYRAADLVVSRAGASTISELQLLGKPCVLVPSPNVAEDHQRKNALALVKHNAAVMIEDANAGRQLGNEIVALLNNAHKLAAMGANVKAMALPDSAKKIVDQLEKIVNA